MNNGEIRYYVFWKIGTIISFLLYYLGIVWLYKLLRRKFEQYSTIVLTYHNVRDDDKYPFTSVSISNFKRQLTFIMKHFDIVPLDRCVVGVETKVDYAKDTIAITFDDGYKDNYLNAFPILKEFNIPATIFLVSRFVNNKDEFLNTAEIKEMRKWNISYGSHTLTHQILSEINPWVAKLEIVNSKEELESLLNENISFFAYPKGKSRHLNDYVKGQIKTAGYRASFTTENGEIEKGGDLFALKRIGIRDCPMFVFKTRVSGILESKLFYLIRILLRIT